MATKAATKKAATKKAATKKTAATAGGRLIPPEGGATIRMYRTGHGDCFLLAFEGDKKDAPVYVLIDCGYKPGSNGPEFIDTSIKDITKSIFEATGGHLDIAVVTHEHQDHVNGISATNFKDFTIGEAWFAWTEDPADELANKFRKKFKDKLLGLLKARMKLAAAGDAQQTARLDDFLSFELGGDDEAPFNPMVAAGLFGAAADPLQSANKISMKVFKDLAKDNQGIKYLRPHEKIMTLPGAKNVRAFAMGPPRDPDQIADMDPQGDEEFHSLALGAALSAAPLDASFDEAMGNAKPQSPFAGRFCLPVAQVFADPVYGAHFEQVYGRAGSIPSQPLGVQSPAADEVAGNDEWRRIDNDWLYSADQLALAMNSQTNNASLVLAFELGKGGKVLLFAADAQRGNWKSWAGKDWKDGSGKVTARDLLSRTVVYKVGHHGSHNATLNGKPADEHPNLAWMAADDNAAEFVAMITAVRAWAETQKGWDHPLKAIKDALLQKASGRVFQTDTAFSKMKMLKDTSEADWKAFQSRAAEHPLYFEYKVLP